MNHQDSTFDAMSVDPIWLAFNAAETEKVEEFLADWQLRPGHRILEPGCGTGRLTARLVPQVAPGGTIVACDTSIAMIEAARQRSLGTAVDFFLTARAGFAYFDVRESSNLR